MDNSVITPDEIMKGAVATNFNEKKATCKTQNFYILLAFLLITTALLISVSTYCHLIKYQTKQTFSTISRHE